MRISIIIAVCSVFGFMVCAGISCTAYAEDSVRLTVVFTGNIDGKLRGCTCPSDPFGGLTERATFIDSLRKGSTDPFLLVDAGNIAGLFGNYDLKGTTAIRLMNLMGYDVAAVDKNELFKGITRGRDIVSSARFPAVNASFVRETDGSHIFHTNAIVPVGDINVGVTAISDSTSFFHVEGMNFHYDVLPVDDALAPVLDSFGDTCDVIVVISRLHPDKNPGLLERYPEIDLLIEGYGNAPFEEPGIHPGGIIVAPGGGGSHVGTVNIAKTGDSVVVESYTMTPLLDISATPEAMAIAREYYKSF
jgi:2',3'-cyclic-nucleotide 2'-phosphodiesterase (5'-nucleotidase family)